MPPLPRPSSAGAECSPTTAPPAECAPRAARSTGRDPGRALTGPFRGSSARAGGDVTAGRLRGPGFTRLHRDVHVAAGTELSHELRARAAALLVPRAVVTGRSALLVLGVDTADGDVEITVPRGSGGWRTPGVRVRRRDLPPEDLLPVAGGMLVQRPAPAVLDAVAELPFVDAVVLLDQVVEARLCTLAELRERAAGHRGRGARRVRVAVAAADGLAGSPQETRLRLRMADAGLHPTAQHTVRTAAGRFVARVDFAWPELRLAVEYDGAHHLQHLGPDRDRLNRLQQAGWQVFFVTAADLRNPVALIARIAAALAARAPATRATATRASARPAS